MGFLSNPIQSISDTVSHVGKVVAENPLAQTALTVGGALMGVPPALTAGVLGANSGTQNDHSLGAGLTAGLGSYGLGTGVANLAGGATGLDAVGNVASGIADNPLGAMGTIGKPLLAGIAAGGAAGAGAAALGGGTSAPAAGGGNLAGLAPAQSDANKDAATWNTNLNRVDQVGPNGSLKWTQGADGRWTQTTSLSPEQQALQDSQNRISTGLAGAAEGALGRVKDSLASPMDLSGLPTRQSGPDASQYQTAQYTATPVSAAQATPAASFGGASASGGGPIQRTFDTSGVTTKLPSTIDDTSRQRVEEALMSRLNPQLQRDNDALRSRLLNSGIEVGTDAYNREMNNFAQQSNDARMQAILAGGQEETRQTQLLQGLNAQQFGQALDTGKFGQAADTSMANNATSASIASANNATAAGIASMQDANKLNLANAAAKNDMAKYNSTLGLETATTNAGINKQNYGIGLAGADFNNTSRNQGISEAVALRNQPINELTALRAGSQVTPQTFGNYYTGGSAGAAPILDAGIAQNNYDLGLATNTQTGQNAMYSGLAGVGGALINNPNALTTIGNGLSSAWDWLTG